MKIRILSWNVRATNDATKRKLIKFFLKTQKVDVVCLQETKWRSCANKIIRSLIPNRFVKSAASCSEGASCGIVGQWASRLVQLVGLEESCHTLSCKFLNCGDNFSWVFTGLYGLSKRDLKEDLWEDLGAIRGMWEDPWCIGGDFNVLRSSKERNREGRWLGDMRRFFQVIDDLVLKDLPLKGGRFTWINGPGNQRMARLDRFLVSDD